MVVSVLGAASCLVTPLAAQQVPDRVTLQSILGGNSTSEGFESYTTIFPGAASIVGPLLDRTTVLGTQGPQLAARAAGETVGTKKFEASPKAS